MADAGPAPRATRREWIGLAVLALPCLLHSMDITVLNMAVPQLTADLQPSASQLLWIMDAYAFLLAGSLITMGTLGDRIGRRRLLLIGAAAFGVVSVLAAFARSAETLIAARALLGVAAATLAPSTLSLIRNMFLDERQRTFAIGIWVASFSAGFASGPLVGGALLAHFWWGSVFLVAVPIMLLLLALGPRLLPESRDPATGRLDLPSAASSLVAILALVYGLKRIATEGGVGWAPALAVAAAAVAGAYFLRRQAALPDPLIDLGLFRARPFRAALAVNLLCVFVAGGLFLLMAQHLQLVLGMGPLEAGLWTAPAGVAFAAGSVVAPPLAARFRPDRAIAGSLALATLGALMLTQAGRTGGPLALVTGFVVLCSGLAPVGTLTTDLVMRTAPPERAGAASGISETSFELGGALGIALLGSLAAAAYRAAMDGAAPPGLPAEASAAARDTLGAAAAQAQQLSGPQAAELLAAAGAAFARALELTAAVGAAIMAGTAMLAAGLLRPARPGAP